MKRAGILALGLFVMLLAFQSEVFAQAGDVASQIAALYAQSTVFLVVQGTTTDGQKEDPRTGTGVVISDEGYVLTASHLFRDFRGVAYSNSIIRGSLGVSYNVKAPTGTIWPLELVRMNTDIDVALAKLPLIPNQPYKGAHFCRSLSVRAGARINALGYPLGQPLSVNSGTLSSKDGPRGLWKTDILVYEGSSGGPVFDGSGHVIGIVKGGIAEAPGNNFIVPANLMLDILQTALSPLDDCAGSSQPLVAGDCHPKVVSYSIELTKDHHPFYSPNFEVLAKSSRRNLTIPSRASNSLRDPRTKPLIRK